MEINANGKKTVTRMMLKGLRRGRPRGFGLYNFGPDDVIVTGLPIIGGRYVKPERFSPEDEILETEAWREMQGERDYDDSGDGTGFNLEDFSA